MTAKRLIKIGRFCSLKSVDFIVRLTSALFSLPHETKQ